VERRGREHRVDGLAEVEREQIGLAHVDGVRQLRARLLDHRRRGVDRDHAAVRQPLEQRARDATGAAAGVQHRLVAAQHEPVEHVAAHRGQRSGDALVRRCVPIARHTFVRYHIRPACGGRSGSSPAASATLKRTE
jgi:hypothetical protein